MKWTKNYAINGIITVIHLLKLPIKLVGKQINKGTKFSHTIMLILTLEQIIHSSLYIISYDHLSITDLLSCFILHWIFCSDPFYMHESLTIRS